MTDRDVKPSAPKGISTGPNARPLDEGLAQTGQGLPDDSSRAVEATPEEEQRLREKWLERDGKSDAAR